MNLDTIVAVSTPHGIGGIALIRISGKEALPISEELLIPSPLHPRHATYCRLKEIDDGIAVFYPAPHSYTGEDTVEFACHGSLYVQEAAVQAFVDAGARLAEAGEFTRRAFANGRLNLSQAEAVADLIDAATPAQHRLAVSQLRGSYSLKLKDLRQQLVDLTALMELELDFSQEDVEFADRDKLKQLLREILAQVATMTASFHAGNALKRGVSVAIVGRPNAGKSSLLNALLGDDRAIVSDIAGTTRDTIEETFTHEGVTFRFIDTAGLRNSSDTIEAQGVERSRRAAEQADAVLYIHDASQPFDTATLNELPADTGRIWVVFNKTDISSTPVPEPYIGVSAKNGDGIETLKGRLAEAYGARGQEVLLSNSRHYDALRRVQSSLGHVESGLERGDIPADLLAVDLRDALYHLGSITGEVANEEVLGNIFSRFCVGK